VLKSISELERPEFERVVKIFLGIHEQMPPIFSAKQVDGVRAYKLAHKFGKETAEKMMQLKPKTITIHDIELLDIMKDNKSFKIRVTCSSGTYIRSLARDIGKALTGKDVGYLKYLLRTQVGEFKLT